MLCCIMSPVLQNQLLQGGGRSCIWVLCILLLLLNHVSFQSSQLQWLTLPVVGRVLSVKVPVWGHLGLVIGSDQMPSISPFAEAVVTPNYRHCPCIVPGKILLVSMACSQTRGLSATDLSVEVMVTLSRGLSLCASSGEVFVVVWS